jgi:hypothetical protein
VEGKLLACLSDMDSCHLPNQQTSDLFTCIFTGIKFITIRVCVKILISEECIL